MKTYVLTLSQVFPAMHPRKGEPTGFKEKVEAAIKQLEGEWWKEHTIRGNYELWRKRFEEIDASNACLSIRIWSGKPYHSKQVEIARLTKEDGIGLQKLEYNFKECLLHIGNLVLDPEELALKDGLTRKDWENWFKGYNFSNPLAIIHFTKFRY